MHFVEKVLIYRLFFAKHAMTLDHQVFLILKDIRKELL